MSIVASEQSIRLRVVFRVYVELLSIYMQRISWADSAQSFHNMEKLALNSMTDGLDHTENTQLQSPPFVKAAFMAAALKDSEALEKIIKRIGPNVKDNHGSPLLHSVLGSDCSCANCMENTDSCLAVLLSNTLCDLELDAVDAEGRTAVHIAAENQLENCLNALIQRGANVYSKSNDGTSAIEVIASRTPDVMEKILDRSIYIETGNTKTESCTLKIDFRPIIGSANCATPQNEMNLLWTLLKSRFSSSIAGKVFTHPAVRIFMSQKWLQMRHQIRTGFIIYLLWLLLYTAYIVYVYVLQCPCRFYKKPSTIVGNLTAGSAVVCHLASGLTLAIIPLILLTVMLLVWNVTKLMFSPSLYFRMRLNVLEFVVITMASATYAPSLLQFQSIPEAHYQVAAFTVFLAWAFTVSELGKFTTTGQYMEMLSHVMQRFWSLIPAYIFLIIAFAVAFSILFPTEKTYALLPFSLFKVIVMMVGELEYQETFYGGNDSAMSNGGPFVGHLLYVLFVVIVAILLMNLLVALTVSDVQSLQREAEISLVSRQIATYHQLESFFYIKGMPRWCQHAYWKITSVSWNVESKHRRTFTFRPNDPRDTSAPHDLKQAALERAKLWQQKTSNCPKKKHYDLNCD